MNYRDISLLVFGVGALDFTIMFIAAAVFLDHKVLMWMSGIGAITSLVSFYMEMKYGKRS